MNELDKYPQTVRAIRNVCALLSPNGYKQETIDCAADMIFEGMRLDCIIASNPVVFEAAREDVPIPWKLLSIRARNCLQREGIKTMRQLADTPECDLLKIRSFGKTTLREVRRILGRNPFDRVDGQ